jgi:predicted alpha/beta hydrolase
MCRPRRGTSSRNRGQRHENDGGPSLDGNGATRSSSSATHVYSAKQSKNKEESTVVVWGAGHLHSVTVRKLIEAALGQSHGFRISLSHLRGVRQRTKPDMK